METEKLTEVLHDLAAINLERAKAYEEASFQNQLFDVELRTTFALLANQSRQNNYLVSIQLEKLLAKTPGALAAQGQLYDQWKSNSGLFSGKDRKSLLDSCEAGETALLAIYEKALEFPVSRETREMFQNQLRGIQSSLTTIKKIIELGVTKTAGNRRWSNG